MRYLLDSFNDFGTPTTIVTDTHQDRVVFVLALPNVFAHEWNEPSEIVAWSKASGLSHDQRDYVVVMALLVFAGVEKHSKQATVLLFDVLTDSPLSSRQVQQIAEELIDGEQWDPHSLLHVLTKQVHGCVVFHPIIAALVHHIALDHLGPQPPAWVIDLLTVVGIVVQADAMEERNASILRDLETIARWSHNDGVRQHASRLCPQQH